MCRTMPYLRVCPAGCTAVVAIALAACAPSLSTLQPANVVGKGHVRAVAALEVGEPLGVLDDLVDRGKTLATASAKGRALTDEEKLQIFDAGVGLLAAPPLVAPLVGISYGVLDRVELDARYAGNGVRGGARVQLVDRATGPFDLTIGAGLGRSVVEIPLADSLPGLSADDFTRYTIDGSALIGTSRDFWRVWAGPRVAWSRFHSALALTIPSEVLVASFDGHGTYVGGQAGAAVGYRKLFFVAELTVARLGGGADAGVIGTIAPTGRHVDVDATIVQPSFGLMGEL
jgi:hypothetical protein